MTLLDAPATPDLGVAGSAIRTTFWRAASKPMAVAGLATAAVVTVGVRDPHAAGKYPSCPSIALFGVHCPGCGSVVALVAFGVLRNLPWAPFSGLVP